MTRVTVPVTLESDTIAEVVVFLSRTKAQGNPWGEGATTLEWTHSSPPPFHTYNELPQIK